MPFNSKKYENPDGSLKVDSKVYYKAKREYEAKERKKARLKAMREKAAREKARKSKADAMAESKESVANKIRARREKNKTILDMVE